MSEAHASAAPTIVLVHGGFVDGSGWEGVYKLLKKDGYDVSVVQNSTVSLAGDVAATRLAIAQAKGPSCSSVIPMVAWSPPKRERIPR